MDNIAWGTDEELTDNQFYNRTDDINFITSLLNTTSQGSAPTILLTGVRGVGKTALIKKLKKQLDDDYLVCYINLTNSNAFQTGRLERIDIIKLIYNELIKSAKEKHLKTIDKTIEKIFTKNDITIDKIIDFKGFPLPIPKFQDNYSKLSEYVLDLPQQLYEEYSDEIKGVLIFFDEFQNIKDLKDETNDFLWYIRGKVQSQKNVAYLFSGSMSLKDKLIENIAGKEGAFGGRILTIEIKPFSYETTKNYLKNNASSIIFTEKGFDRFYKCTKGIPFYINTFVKLLPTNEELNEEKIKYYFKKSLPLLATHFINQWGRLTLQEQRIIVNLLDKPLKRIELAKLLNVQSGSISHPLNLLQNKVLIEKDNDKYTIVDNILKTWLQNQYEKNGVYPFREI